MDKKLLLFLFTFTETTSARGGCCVQNGAPDQGAGHCGDSLCLEVGLAAVIEQQKVESIGMPSEEHMARTVPTGREAQARPGQHQKDDHHDQPLTSWSPCTLSSPWEFQFLIGSAEFADQAPSIDEGF